LIYRQNRSRQWKRILWASGIIVFTLGVLLILIRSGYAYRWTGFGQSKVTNAVQPYKTLWDWLDLLIIPIVLAVGGFLFNRSENQATQSAAERRAQDEALQAYMDQMTQLLTDNVRPLRGAQPGDDLSTAARAHTLTVLPRLDGSRKASILSFLYESDLIGRQHTVIELKRADLRGVRLSVIELSGVNLSGVDLREADLGGANLNNADLRRANLSGHNLLTTRLHNADLREANLENTVAPKATIAWSDLRGADLSGRNLTFAILRDADLRDANLSGVKGITMEKLNQQAKSLKGATMPNGKKYEEWLQDKEGRREESHNMTRKLKKRTVIK
jgi:uncharacterized protein YjbI with pentapeptide repeats